MKNQVFVCELKSSTSEDVL